MSPTQLRLRPRDAAAAFAVLAAVLAVQVQSASAKGTMPHHHEVNALYVIDHLGEDPLRQADLHAYSKEFHTILRSCWINAENLTNVMLLLADKASFQGQRYVTSLMMMKSVARRITWENRRSCGRIFDLAEGHLENGDP